MKYFITGVSGSIGSELYKKLTVRNQIVGCARNKPSWWKDKDKFIAIDLLQDDITRCTQEIDQNTTIIHLLNLAHENIEINKSVSLELLNCAKKAYAKKFIYISSIRVYGGNFGTVDENTVPVPHGKDAYGKAKLDVEIGLTKNNSEDIQLILCRIGSVFSEKTKNKIPVLLRKTGRILNRGLSTHLISANNVSCALSFLVNKRLDTKTYVYNVTQEADGKNNYLYLGDRLNNILRSPKKYEPSNFGKLTRNAIFRLKGASHSSPYVKVVEKNLLLEGFIYKKSLLETLQQISLRNDF
ncbi:hypothetical protein WH96_20200 [Kiloniella spongiae]|uniref:NAD-dependent epimerase/dehydratase domain-containing protein n=1 Tax=Kiloniella spongiae TaxID=1489064 RepID=A0A0H2M8Y6_9PROT|nr:NAD-dependent epimerase/dehydratase family protein [Kiloniella spongiae]KLN58949.1 hypothetical protein WH96_20200 [Kiloniella spongiae]